jgi:hypothetical protein
LPVAGFLTPEPVRDRPQPGEETSRYVQSYLIMRLVVGGLGFALPFALVFIDAWGFDGDPFPRDSLSDYYYSGVRELFVGTLSAIGVFLVTYKVADRTLDNTLSVVAGVFAAVVALCPTERPSDAVTLTPLQERWSEGFVGGIHYFAATVFIVSLGFISYLYGDREGKRPASGKRSPAFWRRFHWACAGAIGVAVVWIAITELAGGPRTSLLIGEAVAVWAFGVSWFWKGFELDALRGTYSKVRRAD